MIRVSSENITELDDNQIFVFGSNLSGFHMGGAAFTAKVKFGAKTGVANGIQGRSYAIPTKSEYIKRTLTIEEIKPYVEEFVEYAKSNPEKVFLVTKIGCGLAEISVDKMAALFKSAGAIEVKNIHMPLCFWNEFKKMEND